MNQSNSPLIQGVRSRAAPMEVLSSERLLSMSLNEQSRRELIEIWLAANDGEASEKDLQRLNAALVEDAEFCDNLLQIIQQQARLFFHSERCEFFCRR